MPRADAAALRDAYDREGYVIVRGALSPERAAQAAQHVHWLLEKNPELKPEDLHHPLAIKDAFWIDLVSEPALLDLAEVFVGPNIALFATHYIAKPPRTGRPVLWHQDGSYWPLEPMDVVTLWLACGPSTRQNGCMRVIPGTQHLDLQEMKENAEVDSVLRSEIEKKYVDESKAVDFELAPGDVSIHNPNLVHGSEANHSDTWRYGLTIRYIPTTTRILQGAGCPFLLRGEAVPGVNESHPRPTFVAGESFLPT